MKKPIRNIMVGLLSTSLGVYMMAAPLATTVYANEYQAPSVYNNNGEMDSQNKSRQIQHEQGGIANKSQNPVEVVKAEASGLGFDAKSDAFTLVSETASTAVVQVIHDGTKHNVTLKRSQQDQDYDQKQDRNQQQNHDQKQDRNQQQGHDQKQDRNQQQNHDQKQDRNQQQNHDQKQDRNQQQNHNQKQDRNQKQDHGQRSGQWTIVSVD